MSNGSWFHKKQGKKWIVLFLVVFLNLLVIEGIILAIEPYWGDFLMEAAQLLGWEGNIILLFIVIIGLPMIYCGLMLGINLRRIIQLDRVNPRSFNKILPIFFLILFDGLFFVILILLGEEAALISSIFEHISIFIFLGILIGLFVLLYPIITYVKKLLKTQSSSGSHPRRKALIFIICVIFVYVFAFSMPFLFASTCIIDGPLTEKPRIIAHRGASHLAPENTLVAGEVAYNLSVDGWEIDVQISFDGVPFLMHDDNLKRTTNVEEIFPARANNDASTFNISELTQLNAGSWFVETDPHRAIAKGLVSPAQQEAYNNASIPTLAEAINFTRDHNLILDLDLKGPPSEHPYYAQYFNICLSLLNASGLDKQIWMVAYSRAWLDLTAATTNLTTAWGIEASDPPSVAEILASGYEMINSHYSLPDSLLEAYLAAGITVVLYTIDLEGLFSQLWCSGVPFIKTNEPHIMVELIQPVWYMHTETYIIFWLVIYILGLSFVSTLQFGRTANSKGVRS